MNRRKFLTVAGGGIILAAGAATGWVATRTPTKALAPWEKAGSDYDEPRQKALSYAILAPNPHNRQPWIVDLSKPDTVILKVDTGRMLPHTDPFNRQITVGLGCFLELMTMAAAEDGYRVDITLFPDGFDSNDPRQPSGCHCHFRKGRSRRTGAAFCACHAAAFSQGTLRPEQVGFAKRS